ncbi:hypothetical protein [Rhodococcus aetherivorans]|uniref:hypothetical protein n=1 Tax=Rhodococcus aetherivorans TaxID=191292 RepID=UPI00241E5A4F|nr:hypothetical protein [Rhodococcus aetherivorans]WFS11091.1 hypothetical protein P9K37_14795 [Rhodococcus aetherivorans]
MILKVGQSLASTVDSTTLIVVRAPKGDVSLTCGGVEMTVGKKGAGDGASIDSAHRGGAALGKRYVDDEAGLEVLCTKPGEGQLAIDGRVLPVKDAKPLPSSD